MAIPTRDRLTVAAGGVVALVIASVLIWVLWVLPINRSQAAAVPVEIGETISVPLTAGEQRGIWGSGRSMLLGSAACTVTDPEGTRLPLRSTNDLGWGDTLWWMTARPGYSEHRSFTAAIDGLHEVTCRDALDTYDGEFFVALSASATGTVGVGQGGGVRYPLSSMLAFGAVACPLTAALLTPIIVVQGLRLRRQRASRRERDGDILA